ncbi:MAG: PBSX family phage terminase large subunit [Spirochaetales bacterium]|jgi:phage terminase large subunit|nr:PBSX family phage terminase large subunit [Spirochaetales bacterium]
MISETEEIELIELLEQDTSESIVPLLDPWRNPARFKMAYGGRGGGKSMAAASLLVQRANNEHIKILCAREIQKSIQESVYALIKATVERLKYSGWIFKTDEIVSTTGSRFVFRGLKDLRASQQIKSYEGFDVIWVEEAAAVSDESWNIIVPTFRKEGSEIWATFNRDKETDPVYERFCANPRLNSIVIETNWNDNPWFPDILRVEMEQDYERDPDEAIHVWGGQPRKQGQKAVMSRVAIRGAMNRVLKPEGVIQVGCDPARFGDDTTQIYKRHGFVTIDHRGFAGQDTMRTAYECWDLAGRDPSVMIVVDETGIGSGVVDRLRELGAKVVGVNFGGSPTNRDKYTSIADELWFEFPVDEADIPNDTALMQQLSGRQYDYTKDGKRKVESKDRYKERCGKSPDHADAVLLTYFSGGGVLLDKDIREAMKKRRKR